MHLSLKSRPSRGKPSFLHTILSRKTCKYRGKSTKSTLFPKRMLKYQGKPANIKENRLKAHFSLIWALSLLHGHISKKTCNYRGKSTKSTLSTQHIQHMQHIQHIQHKQHKQRTVYSICSIYGIYSILHIQHMQHIQPCFNQTAKCPLKTSNSSGKSYLHHQHSGWKTTWPRATSWTKILIEIPWSQLSDQFNFAIRFIWRSVQLTTVVV